MKIDKLR